MNKKLTAFVLLVLISFIVYKINTYSEKYSEGGALSEAEKRGCRNYMGDDFCNSIEDKHCKAWCDGCGKRCHGKLKSDDGKKCVCSTKVRGAAKNQLGSLDDDPLQYWKKYPKCKISGSEFIKKHKHLWVDKYLADDFYFRGSADPGQFDDRYQDQDTPVVDVRWTGLRKNGKTAFLFRHHFIPNNSDIKYPNPLACLPGGWRDDGKGHNIATKPTDQFCFGDNLEEISCGYNEPKRPCEDSLSDKNYEFKLTELKHNFCGGGKMGFRVPWRMFYFCNVPGAWVAGAFPTKRIFYRHASVDYRHFPSENKILKATEHVIRQYHACEMGLKWNWTRRGMPWSEDKLRAEIGDRLSSAEKNKADVYEITMGQMIRKHAAGLCTPPGQLGFDHMGYCTGSKQNYYQTKASFLPFPTCPAKNKESSWCGYLNSGGGEGSEKRKQLLDEMCEYNCSSCPLTCSGKGKGGWTPISRGGIEDKKYPLILNNPKCPKCVA